MVVLEIVNKKAPKVGGTKISNDEPLDVKPPLPGWVYASLVVGGPSSGKTSLIIGLLKKYYKKKYDRVILFSGSLQTLPDSFLEKLNEERVFGNLDNLEEVIEELKNGEEKYKTLIIFDDLVKEINEKQKTIMGLLYNRRHISGSISVFMITQKLTKIPLSLRSAFDTIYFFSIRNKKEVESLYDDYINDLSREQYNDIIKYVLKSPVSHPFLFINRRDGKYYLKFNELKIQDEIEETKPATPLVVPMSEK